MMEGNREIPQQQPQPDFGGADFANVIPDLITGIGEIAEGAYEAHHARKESEDDPATSISICHLGSNIPTEREIRWSNALRTQLGLPLLDYQTEHDKALKTWRTQKHNVARHMRVPRYV